MRNVPVFFVVVVQDKSRWLNEHDISTLIQSPSSTSEDNCFKVKIRTGLVFSEKYKQLRNLEKA